MTRTEKEIKKCDSHSQGCFYPNEPCGCEVQNKSQRRTWHENWCTYPSDPCDCGLI